MNKTTINPLSGRRIKIGKTTFRKVLKFKKKKNCRRSLGNKRKISIRNKTNIKVGYRTVAERF